MINITKENYEKEILQENNIPVIVDFWSPICIPCKALSPKIQEMEKEYNGKIKFVSIDCCANKKLSMDFNVMGLPTFVIYKNGKEVTRISKNKCDEKSIRSAIENVI